MEADHERIRCATAYLQFGVRFESIGLRVLWLVLVLFSIGIGLAFAYIPLIILGLHWPVLWAAFEMLARLTGTWLRRGEPPEQFEIWRLVDQIAITLIGDVLALVITVVLHFPEAIRTNQTGFAVLYLVVFIATPLSSLGILVAVIIAWRAMARVHAIRGPLRTKDADGAPASEAAQPLFGPRHRIAGWTPGSTAERA
jgi:hypothetical protein